MPGDGSAGVGPAIIAAPPSVTNDSVTFLGQVGFNERQDVTTSKPYEVDFGLWVPEGSVVDSHMIFLNGPGGTQGVRHLNVVWTFADPVLAVMSDNKGVLEALSTDEFRLTGTTYPTTTIPGLYDDPQLATNRGLEISAADDDYSILGNTLTLSMGVGQPGDWIRVITGDATLVPTPGAVILGMIGLSVAGMKLRKRT